MIHRLLAAVLFGSVACFAILAEPVSGANWPRFRGPNGTGEATDKDIPVEFSGEKGYLWKTPLPGAGHSSPIVFNGRIFLQTATPDASERIMLCLNLADGKIVWQSALPGTTAVKHKLSSFASPTAATDGVRVYMPFWDGKNLLLAAFDFNDGKLLWKTVPRKSNAMLTISGGQQPQLTHAQLNNLHVGGRSYEGRIEPSSNFC